MPPAIRCPQRPRRTSSSATWLPPYICLAVDHLLLGCQGSPDGQAQRIRGLPMKPAEAQSKKAYRRLAPADRRRQIIEAAVSYFSEVGFDGATRALAERLGVTQPLIYRYFPSKDELIRAVYEEVYTGRWRDEWLELLGRRDR